MPNPAPWVVWGTNPPYSGPQSFTQESPSAADIKTILEVWLKSTVGLWVPGPFESDTMSFFGD